MNIPKPEQKQVFLKPYGQILELENALKLIHQMDFNKIAISVIGILEGNYKNNPKDLEFIEIKLTLFFKKILGQNTEFSTFYNPELGRLFVAGFLVPTFLNPVGRKAIGVLSGGPYGILRGLGVSEEQAGASVKKLIDGTFFLVARGDRLDIEKLENTLTD
ncbi:hypothetical protein I2486_14540 [Cellulophaga sp. E16_2]|uniref:Uncharacterized protein n=1 Tax=Cellulophaga algicola (strain DSM 14237 / IC166 / ACAM 630) TaxID=688270 RepID=E6XEC8_CELAD|nr:MULTISPECIES: hypothetical protein [Cellulophaga]ADV50218.1 hypothetical protein Celal_2942 [Cellulophaga algicola DSM 14237]MBO0592619.1 hypothetical protein [Cellulophaga sp. E16_2]